MKKIIFIILLFLLFSSVIVYSKIETNKAIEEKVEKDVIKDLEENNIANVIIILKEDKKPKMKSFESISVEEDEFKITHRFENAVSGSITKKGLDKIIENENIELIGKDVRVKAFLDNSIALINGTKAWNLKFNYTNLTGNAESVCVIDSGIDTDHTDLQNNILAQHCFCNNDPKDPPNGCCPNNLNESTNAEDDNGHGTHVSGIIASNNNVYKGVAPGAKIVAVKVLDSVGSGWSTDVVEAIDWCTNISGVYNISVISMSLGSGTFNSYCDTNGATNILYRSRINSAYAKNISIVISTGNDGKTTNISAPACIKNATPVGAVFKTNYARQPPVGIWSASGCSNQPASKDQITCFTNRGLTFPNILLAPGCVITSTARGGGTTTDSGTSQAAPVVSGAIAVLREFLRIQNGTDNLTPQNIEEILNSTGKPVNDTSGSARNYTRIDLHAAIISLDSVVPIIKLINPTNGSSESSTNVTFNYNTSEIGDCNLYLNSTGSFSINTTNNSVVTGTSNFTVEFKDNSSVLWRVECNDSANNYANSTKNWTVNINKTPLISFGGGTSSNYTNISRSWVFANVSVTEANERNITFYIKNTTAVVNSTSYITSQRTLNWTTNLTIEDNYTYNVTVCDSQSNCNSTENRLIIIDTSPPSKVGNLINTSISSSSVVLNWTSATDNRTGIMLYKIYRNGTNIANTTGKTYTNSGLNSTTTYIYNVSSYDYAGNENSTISLTITTPVTPPSSSSGGGGGGGGGSSKVTAQSVSLGQSPTTYKGLKRKDKLQFESKQETHTLTVNQVKTDKVEFMLASDVIKFSLSIGEERIIELNPDEKFYIKLDNIDRRNADITLKKIVKKVLPVITAPKEEVKEEEPEVNETVTEEPLIEEEKSAKKHVIGVSIILVLVLVGSFIFIKKIRT